MSVKQIIALWIVFPAGLCLGQEQVIPGGPERPDPARAQAPGQRGLGEFGPLAEKMATDLKLDPTQIAEVKRLVEEHQKAMREMQSEMRQSPETIQKMKELREKMHQAQQANDQAGMKAASDEMQAMRQEQATKIAPARSKMAQARETLRDKVKGVLREDQKAGFDAIWDEYAGGGSGRRMMRQNPRLLRATVERLSDLTPDQKRQIDEQFKQHDEATKGQKGAAVETQTQRLYDGVLALLTPQQREKVESRMPGREPRRPRGPRPPDGTEGTPGAPSPPQPEKPGP